MSVKHSVRSNDTHTPHTHIVQILFFLSSFAFCRCPLVHLAKQGSRLCRQKRGDLCLSFLILVLSIHLPVSPGVQPVSSLLQTPKYCIWTVTRLISCLCICVHKGRSPSPLLHVNPPSFSSLLCLQMTLQIS